MASSTGKVLPLPVASNDDEAEGSVNGRGDDEGGIGYGEGRQLSIGAAPDASDGDEMEVEESAQSRRKAGLPEQEQEQLDEEACQILLQRRQQLAHLQQPPSAAAVALLSTVSGLLSGGDARAAGQVHLDMVAVVDSYRTGDAVLSGEFRGLLGTMQEQAEVLKAVAEEDQGRAGAHVIALVERWMAVRG